MLSCCARSGVYLRTYVRMLRKKIENNPARPEYILTEPWVGYRFLQSVQSRFSVRGRCASHFPSQK
jgi:hypothetical protein